MGSQVELRVDLPDLIDARIIDATITRDWREWTEGIFVEEIEYSFVRAFPDDGGENDGKLQFLVRAELRFDDSGAVVRWFDKFVEIFRLQYPPGYEVSCHSKIPKSDGDGFWTASFRRAGKARTVV